MFFELLEGVAFATPYEGEEPPPQQPETVLETDAPPPKTEEPPPPKPNPKTKPNFDPKQQAYINSLLAEERRKLQTKNEDLILQLETIKNQASTTAAERQTLEDRIELLKGEYTTREELQQRETSKRITDLEKRVKEKEIAERRWIDKYHEKTLLVDLTHAAVEGEAYDPEQVVALLRQNARAVEEIGPDGKPTGHLTTRVRMQGKGEDGKPVQLDLSAPEAIKLMKEQQRYANQFLSKASGGLGAIHLAKTKDGEPDPSRMSTEDYMRYRREQMKSKSRR